MSAVTVHRATADDARLVHQLTITGHNPPTRTATMSETQTWVDGTIYELEESSNGTELTVSRTLAPRRGFRVSDSKARESLTRFAEKHVRDVAP